MPTLVSKVEDVFQLCGRGCVVVPGIPKAAPFRIKVGDPLLLKRPEGSELQTVLRGFEMVEVRGPTDYPGIPVLLGPELTKDQVPIGTEVWATFDALQTAAVFHRLRSGVFRSANDSRQFRMNSNSLLERHAPGAPHGHLESLEPGATRPTSNIHITVFD
jgi:hypothetical protein